MPSIAAFHPSVELRNDRQIQGLMPRELRDHGGMTGPIR
jgi:hypothetical protein